MQQMNMPHPLKGKTLAMILQSHLPVPVSFEVGIHQLEGMDCF